VEVARQAAEAEIAAKGHVIAVRRASGAATSRLPALIEAGMRALSAVPGLSRFYPAPFQMG
jgi:hypothetical protein